MITRRRFLSSLAAGSLAAGFYTWRVEPVWTEYVRRDLPVKDLPDALAGATLVHLSDLHVGRQVDDRFLREVFARVQAMNPDIVAHTGDFVSYAGPETLAQFERIASFLPRGRLGTVAVLGNHDYGWQWHEAVVAAKIAGILVRHGCTVLRNQMVSVHGLNIAGLDDLWSGRMNLEALDGMWPPALVLCHNPDACDLPGWEKFSGWILAGHTHGGQCKPPFLPAPLLPVKNRRYTSGVIELSSGRMLYISRGLGHLLRVRFNVRPEVTIFTLRPA